MIPFFESTETPEVVRWGFLAFAALIVLIPLIRNLVSVLGFSRVARIITAAAGGIRVEERTVTRRRLTEVPAGAVLDIDDNNSERNKRSAGARAVTVSANGASWDGNARSTPSGIPSWVEWQGGLSVQKGSP